MRRALVCSETLEHAIRLFSHDAVANEHQLFSLRRRSTFHLMASLIRFLILAIAPSTVQHHVVDFICEQVFPYLEILPVPLFKSDRNLREVLLLISEKIEQIAVQDFLKELIEGFTIFKADLLLLGFNLLLLTLLYQCLLFFLRH